jgi:hypothetical protein
VNVGIDIGGISSPGEFDGDYAVDYQAATIATVAPGLELPPAPVQPTEYLNAAAPSIDLELVDIRLVDAGSISNGVGPRFRLFCRNNGLLEAPKFRISVMADLGKELTEKAHQVTVESVGIQPGKTQTVDVQMPVEVLKMTTANDHWARPFELLGATLDSDNSLIETDKSNNALVLTRDAIKTMTASDATSAK